MWKFAFTALAESTWRSYKLERMLAHWSNYKIYLNKYEQKIRTKQKDQQLDPKEVEYLSYLEKELNLESILDVRNMLKEKHKVTELKRVCVFLKPIIY